MAILRKRSWRITPEGVLYWMLSLTIMVDFLNGLIPQISFGTIYRFVLLLYVIYLSAKYSAKRFMFIFFCGVFFLLNIVFSFFAHSSTFGVSYDLKMMMRVLTSMCTCSALIALYHKKRFTFRMIQKVIENNLMYTPALFIGTFFLGIGNVSYEYNSVGFKSVFLSLNSINVALIVMYAYAVFQVFNSSSTLKWCMLSLYVMVPMLMLGTKTALALVILIPASSIFLNMKTKKGRYAGMAIIMVALFISIFLLDQIMLALQGVFERQAYLFANRDLISYLFSGRNWVLEDAMNLYTREYNVFEYLFGRGYYYSHNMISDITEYLSLSEVRPIEMDWADLLLAYGPLGFLPTYVYSFKILSRGFKLWKHKNVQPYMFTALLIIAFGFLAGHVYIEAISSTFLAFLLSAVYMGGNDQKLIQRQARIQDIAVGT